MIASTPGYRLCKSEPSYLFSEAERENSVVKIGYTYERIARSVDPPQSTGTTRVLGAHPGPPARRKDASLVKWFFA